MFKNIKFTKTEDNSVGLYSNSVNDIFHSKSGALKEAYDKFINPLISTNIECRKILDICYGIGYNSKSALKEFYKNEIIIDALEYDNVLVDISSFINDCIEDDELKLFIISQITNLNNNPRNVLDILNQLYSLNMNEFLSSFTTNLKEHLYNQPYSYSGLVQNNSFLHNIYSVYGMFRYTFLCCM